MQRIRVSQNIKDKVVIGIQTRMSSRRLPGKALMPILNTTILGATIQRCIASTLKTYILTSLNEEDNLIVKESKNYGISGVIRGSLDNVLERYQMLAEQTGAEYIIRVTADNPFTDTLGIINLANSIIEKKYLYLIHREKELPIGYHSELFNSTELYRSYNNNKLAEEHVTYSIKKNVDISFAKSLNYHLNKKILQNLKCSIDEREDYCKAIRLIGLIKGNIFFEDMDLTNKLIKISNKI